MPLVLAYNINLDEFTYSDIKFLHLGVTRSAPFHFALLWRITLHLPV